MPTMTELEAARRDDLSAAICNFGGFSAVARQLGRPLRGRGRTENWKLNGEKDSER